MRRILPALLLLLVAVPVTAQQDATAPPAPKPAGFDHDHGEWSGLLKKNVHPGGRVHYKGLALERVKFDHYIASLEGVSARDFERWSSDQQFAFWINAYNVYAIQLILDNYPVKSIKDMGGLFSSVFSKRFVPLQHLSSKHSKKLSLGEIEHDILFGLKRGPMFHFGIVCASASCPVLRAEAFSATNAKAQLAEQARIFLADPTKNRQAPTGTKLHVSKIFDWAEDEFSSYKGGIAALLKDHGPPAVREHLQSGARMKLKFLSYDWSLNEWQPPKSSTL